jgi:hypothetical protein
MAMVLVGGCAANVGTAVHQSGVHTLVYSAAGSGTATASNIYFGGYDRGASVSSVPLSWTRTIRTERLITAEGPVSLSVQNEPLALSYVVSTIRADGKVLSKEKAVGPHAMAQCQA